MIASMRLPMCYRLRRLPVSRRCRPGASDGRLPGPQLVEYSIVRAVEMQGVSETHPPRSLRGLHPCCGSMTREFLRSKSMSCRGDRLFR